MNRAPRERIPGGLELDEEDYKLNKFMKENKIGMYGEKKLE